MKGRDASLHNTQGAQKRPDKSHCVRVDSFQGPADVILSLRKPQRQHFFLVKSCVRTVGNRLATLFERAVYSFLLSEDFPNQVLFTVFITSVYSARSLFVHENLAIMFIKKRVEVGSFLILLLNSKVSLLGVLN